MRCSLQDAGAGKNSHTHPPVHPALSQPSARLYTQPLASCTSHPAHPTSLYIHIQPPATSSDLQPPLPTTAYIPASRQLVETSLRCLWCVYIASYPRPPMGTSHPANRPVYTHIASPSMTVYTGGTGGPGQLVHTYSNVQPHAATGLRPRRGRHRLCVNIWLVDYRPTVGG